MDRIGQKIILYYDDGVRVTRREIIVKSEDAILITATDGQIFNKNRIVRAQVVQ